MGSISQNQKRLGGKSFVDLGEDDITIQNVELDATERALTDLATEYITRVEAEMLAKDVKDSGKGIDSVQATELKRTKGVLEISVVADQYVKYQDKGVSGVENKMNTPYSFKTTGVGKNMMTELRKWVIRNSLRAKATDVRRYGAVGNREKLGASFKNTSQSVAYAIATNIKKRGIKGKDFLTKPEKELQQSVIEKKMAEALVIDIINSF